MIPTGNRWRQVKLNEKTKAYLRLAQQNPVHFADRNHFFAVAALSMRQILVAYARSRRAGDLTSTVIGKSCCRMAPGGRTSWMRHTAGRVL
jgi:hypothetical protein